MWCGEGERQLKQVRLTDLKRNASVAKFKEWIPCEIVADGEVIGCLVSSVVTIQEKPPERTAVVVTSGFRSFSKSDQASKRGFNA